jgi:hypothetical protein
MRRIPILRNVCLAAAALVAGAAYAQEPPGPPQPMPQQPGAGQPSERTVGKLTTVTAKVEKVDRSKRELTLRPEGGQPFTMYVPEDVKRFENVKAGDQITFNYYESTTIALEKPGVLPKPEEQTVRMRASGKLPSGAVGREITGMLEVDSVDVARNQLTLKDHAGNLDTIQVKDPQLQSQLRSLQPGDRVRVQYMEAVAVSMAPKG